MKRVLFLVNHDVVIYNFRLEIVERLLSENIEVHISSPYGERIDDLIKLGCIYHNIEISRHGTNPFKEFKLIQTYKKLLDEAKPDIVFTYTIKPNIYGGISCRVKHIPFVANITGLGTALESNGLSNRLVMFMYKFGLRKAQKVFFQNRSNMDFMASKGIVKGRYELLPGSGVNLERNPFEAYPDPTKSIVLLVIGRIMKEKGTDEMLEAARNVKKQYPDITIRFLGFYDGDYQSKIEQAVADGSIEYLGQKSNVHYYIRESHATVLASYHEGMANVLLETASSGRPVIATDVPGCKETFIDGVSGISCKPRDAEDLTNAIIKFIQMPYSEKVAMGIAGRKHVEQNFDRTIVVNKYLEESAKAVRKKENHATI